jgi:hypothetical protein
MNRYGAADLPFTFEPRWSVFLRSQRFRKALIILTFLVVTDFVYQVLTAIRKDYGRIGKTSIDAYPERPGEHSFASAG